MVVRVLASLKGSMRRHEHCDASLPHHSCHLASTTFCEYCFRIWKRGGKHIDSDL